MITIQIAEETRTQDEMVDLLLEIARQIQNGCTSGYYPTWSLSGNEETEGEDE